MNYGGIVENALVQAQADALYLLLDCSNDPLTATLQGENFSTYEAAELIVNGDFAVGTGWVFGGNWQWNAGSQWAEIPGTIGFLGNLSPTVPLSIEIGRYYHLKFTLSVSNGYVDPSCGGVTLARAQTTGSYSVAFKATATTNLNFYGEVIAGAGKYFLRLDNVELHELGEFHGYGRLVGAELDGSLTLAAAGVTDVGEDGVGLRRIYLDNGIAAGPTLTGSGLICKYTGGDMFIGNDSIFPGYYVQKTVVHGSLKTDNSDDYTNLYQGNSGYQQIGMMYDVEYSPSPINGVNIGNGGAVTNPPPLFMGGSTFATAFGFRLDRTNLKMLMGTTSATTATILEILLGGTDPTVRPDTDDLIDLGDATNSLRWRNLYLSQMARIGGTLDHDGSAAGFFGAAPVAQQTAPAALTDSSGGSTDDVVDAALPGDYGELYAVDNAVATAIAVAGTWYQFTQFGAVGQANGAVPSTATDDITVARAGVYLVTASCCFNGSPLDNIEVEVQTNNGAVRLTNLRARRRLNASGDVGSVSLSGLASLSVNDTVELWVRNITAAAAVTICNVNLSVVEIGGLARRDELNDNAAEFAEDIAAIRVAMINLGLAA